MYWLERLDKGADGWEVRGKKGILLWNLKGAVRGHWGSSAESREAVVKMVNTDQLN